MTSRLQNALRMHAASQDGAEPMNRWGVVQSVDPVTMTAKVMVQPENVLTGFLPILSGAAGAGSGLVSPPTAGQMAKLVPDAGDPDSYVIIGFGWNIQSMPPAGAASGEHHLVHSSGARVTLLNDGSCAMTGSTGATVALANTGHILLNDPSGTTLELTNNGSVALTGILAVTGSIKVDGVTVEVP
jgi:phage baseplate assembly protein V